MADMPVLGGWRCGPQKVDQKMATLRTPFLMDLESQNLCIFKETCYTYLHNEFVPAVIDRHFEAFFCRRFHMVSPILTIDRSSSDGYNFTWMRVKQPYT